MDVEDEVEVELVEVEVELVVGSTVDVVVGSTVVVVVAVASGKAIVISPTAFPLNPLATEFPISSSPVS